LFVSCIVYAFVVVNCSKATTIVAVDNTISVEAAVERVVFYVFDVPLALLGLGTLVKLAVKGEEGFADRSFALQMAKLTISVKVSMKYAFKGLIFIADKVGI
jgi:hypothetical protein